MGYFYNRAFKIGVVSGVIIFLLINVAAYIIASRDYERHLFDSIGFSPAPSFRWGFPFIWDGYNFGYFEDGILNILVATVFGILGGIIFRYLDLKIKG